MQEQQTDNVKIIAHCIFPLSTNGKYSFTFGGWKLIEHSVSNAKFETEINNSDLESNYNESIQNLESILLAMFINDFIPKKINFLEIVGLNRFEQNLQIRLITLIGQRPIVPKSIEQEALDSFSMMGMAHMFITKFHDTNYAIPDEIIGQWFNFFSNNKDIANGFGLIHEGYRIINGLQTNQFNSFFDEFSFRNAILLIVSGLESLFAMNEAPELRFRFSIIGSIYYDKFVSSGYFNQFATIKKIPSPDFMDILKKLYDVRSAIAHGSSEFLITKIKEINTILEKLHIQKVKKINQHLLRGHVLLLFSLLQPHIIGIIAEAKEKLNDGDDIVKEIFSRQGDATQKNQG